MRLISRFTVLNIILTVLLSYSCQDLTYNNIDRQKVIRRHNIVTTVNNPNSPAQVGNGEFAFGVDITGLQTFIPFNTMAQWSWHSFPMPGGERIEDFKGVTLATHDRNIKYQIPNSEQTVLSDWLAGNPHRFNLGRIGLMLYKNDGSAASLSDLKNTKQETDLWRGIIKSNFELEGKTVEVITACHPSDDVIGVSISSDLISSGQIKIFFDFPYADSRNQAVYVGDYSKEKAHKSVIDRSDENSAVISRRMDDSEYYVNLTWDPSARLLSGDTIKSSHRFYLDPPGVNKFEFTCMLSRNKREPSFDSAEDVFSESSLGWKKFWESGAAIDLSQSKDPRWKELERRIVLSQYLMKVNEAGSFPPQESGLVNNGWYGRFHFEMIWWHGVHYALWDRWPLLEKSLHVYKDFLPTSIKRAEDQGYDGARWPKCTADIDREWPHIIHALLIWQQPHPIYFAELDYRLHPTSETLDRWKEIVFNTADFMANFAFFDRSSNRYVLSPPIYIMSENTDPEMTFNPAFELGYWRFGLRTAQKWKERLGQAREAKWDQVLDKLAPLPQENGVYITYEKIDSMWTRFSFEHPGLIGTFGMLPGDGVDTACFITTLDKVTSTWNFNRTWGWDFPMVAMAAARSGNTELAVDMLLHSSPGFQFDEHGLASGGPFPYFPSNGALLTAVAMMAAGWDGSDGNAPGFPKNGEWIVQHEGFKKMP
ncbi:MAG TPA: hypothetical protein VMV47_12675 [Bacteroidales bacterium]|nr:hypothetical protein [Bacteroidales bacterium]